MDQNLIPSDFNDINEKNNHYSFFNFLDEDSNAPKSFSLFSDNNNSNQEDSSWNNHDHYFLNNNQDEGLRNDQAIQNINNNHEEGARNNQAINNLNNGNDNGNDNNINTKPLFKVDHKQQLENKTTRYTTNITKAKIEKIENQKEEEKEEKEEKQEKKIKDNTKQDSVYEDRNYPNIFIRNFFENLIDFINELIKISNKTKKTNIDFLLNINKKYFIKYGAKRKLEMLQKKAFDFLTIDLNDIKDQKDKENIVIFFIERLRKIYNDPNNVEINSVLNKTIQELLDIYREKVETKEEFYIHFKRFKEHYNNTNKGEEYKEKLKTAGEQFEEQVNELLNGNNDHKKGRKANK
jgi:hypothetical protein